VRNDVDLIAIGQEMRERMKGLPQQLPAPASFEPSVNELTPRPQPAARVAPAPAPAPAPAVQPVQAPIPAAPPANSTIPAAPPR
jgi:hypothetical protein